MFMLDQKVWLRVKYSVESTRIGPLAYHCAAGDDKIVLFGGIKIEDRQSRLSNGCYIVTVK